ncbi:MAG: hypothetical protein IT382_21810 [Deltaproteobacteria bacterium]|nr:hypothetical protein [Deltaproteobacteria bacterium]
MIVLRLAAAGLLAGATPALAQDGLVATPRGASDAAAEEAAVDDSQPPAAQKEAFKLFTGTWRCDGKANTELAPEVPTRITLSFKSDGRWLQVKMEEQKSKQNPKATSSTEVWGHSAALGGFVRNGADNQGGFYAGKSSGWVGERFWWTTDSARGGKRVQLKDTFTKVSDKELTLERAFDPTGSGDGLRVVFEGSCKR